MARFSFFFLVAALFAGLAFASSAKQNGAATLDEIISRFTQKLELDSAYVGDNYTHTELEVTETLKDGVVSGVERKLYHVEKDAGVLYKELVSKDDVAVENSQRQAKTEMVSVSTSMLSRYNFSLRGVETLDGQTCWVLSFAPKPNLPEKTREDKALNNMAGEIWVEQGSYSFKKMATHLLSPVNYSLAGIAGGKLQMVNAVIKATSIEGRFAICGVEVEYSFSGKVLFVPVVNRHERKNIKYTNYERRVR